MGVLWKVPQAEPRHNLVACRCWQAMRDIQRPCKRLQPSYRPSANSLTLVPTGTTEYIAAGDSQAAVPFPTEIGRDFDLQWKTASGLSYLLLQLVVTAGKRAFQRRALRRPHPARREVTCGDTDMDWPRLGAVLHTTGLWGKSYLGVGRRAASRTWQKLCQREDTGLPWGKPYRGRIHIWDYPKGNQAIRTPSPVQGLTGDPGELTPVLGLASDCSAQSDCRGCLEDSTRVHHPRTKLGRKRRSYPGEGEWCSKRDTGQFFPPITCYPTHGKKLDRRRDCRILRRCSGVPSPQLCRCCQRGTNAWEEAKLLVEWALTPRGHGSPCDWYAKATASTIQWANLCLETAFPFCCHPWQTKSCSELLMLRVQSTYMRNGLTWHSNAKAGSASSEGSACRFTTWSRKGVVGTLGTYPGRGLKTTWE